MKKIFLKNGFSCEINPEKTFLNEVKKLRVSVAGTVFAGKRQDGDLEYNFNLTQIECVIESSDRINGYKKIIFLSGNEVIITQNTANIISSLGFDSHVFKEVSNEFFNVLEIACIVDV